MKNIRTNDEVYDFGLRLKKMRLKAKLTQKQVADKLDVHKNTISSYENNIKQPSLENFRKLAFIYRASSDYLLGLESQVNIYVNDLPISKQILISNIIDCVRKENQETK